MTAATRQRERLALGLLAALYVAAVVIYVVLGRRVAVPLISRDEFVYGHLARSIAGGDGLDWRGEGYPLRGPLYAYLIAPPWRSASALSAYEATKLLGALLTCSVVLPVWLLARRPAGPLLALVPALLSVAGAQLLLSSTVLTEVLADPLAVASLAAMVPALSRPGSRWWLVALALALLAALARQQLAVLPLVLVLATAADLARHGRSWRVRLHAHRALAITTLALGAIVALTAIVASDATLGIYAPLSGRVPSIGALLAAFKDQLAALVVACAVLPAAIVLAAASGRAAWRDDELGPLLCVTLAAVLVLVAESAWLIAFEHLHWSIERYLVYALPLLYVAMTVALARGFASVRRLGVTGLLVVAIVLVIPGVRQIIEEPATFGLALRGGDLLGLGASTGVTLALLAAATTAIALLALQRSRRPTTAVLGPSAAVLLVLVIAGQAAWTNRVAASRHWRSAFPSDLAWIDHRAGGPVARFISYANSPRNEVGEFFNRSIERVYVPSEHPIAGLRLLPGRVCHWGERSDGVLQFERRCGAPPRRLLIDDDVAMSTFYGQRVVAATRSGRVLAFAAGGAPRLHAILAPPCSRPLPFGDSARRGRLFAPAPQRCTGTLSGQLVLDRAARLVLHFSGGSSDRHLSLASGRVFALPAGRPTTLSIPAPAGNYVFIFNLDWIGPPPTQPGLRSAELVEGGARTAISYW